MKHNFPQYKHDDDVGCFNCGTSLAAATPQDMEFPPGRGQFRKACPQCGLHTYYDLAIAQSTPLLEGGVT